MPAVFLPAGYGKGKIIGMIRKKIRKKAFCAFFSVLCLLSLHTERVKAVDYWPEEPAVASPSAIVIEASTGAILYEKNSREVHYPASITKIMTSLIALENSSLDETVIFSADAVFKNEGGTSHIARDLEEEMTMEQCLYAVMLESANECAYAVAEHIAGEGNVEGFCDRMNQRAAELGCANTHFVNPNGLHDDNHYTTCYDMALIAKEAYQNETFRIITGTKSYVIPPTNKHEEETLLNNHNKMLHPYMSAKYVYEYCTGGKTGYTSNANATLVEYAEKDGMTLISVVMNTDNESQWVDSTNLFNYCFDNFQLFNISENETAYSDVDRANRGSLNGNSPFVEMDPAANIVLPKTAAFTEAQSVIEYNDEVSETVGTISYTYAGRTVGSADIIATGAEIETFDFDNQKESETEESKKEEEKKPAGRVNPLMIVLIMVGALILTGLLFLLKYIYDNMYIFRHNRMVRKNRKQKFREVKKRRTRRRRRR